ncbi:MAG: DUF4384 domain-containing protein [Bryobacteraceae bacterium]
MRLPLLAALLIPAGLLSAQTEHKLTARELFYTPVSTAPVARVESPRVDPPKLDPAPKTIPKIKKPVVKNQDAVVQDPGERPDRIQLVSAVTYPPLGLRYSLLRRSDSGRYDEVSTDTTFHSGDKIKVVVRGNDPGYLYVISRGTSGTWMVQFPSSEIDNGNNRISKDQEYTVPSGGRFNFTDQPGEEKLFIVFSRKPAQDLEKLIYSLGNTKAPAPVSNDTQEASPKVLMMASSRKPIEDPFVNRLRSQLVARDLVFEKVDDDTPGDRKEKAVYVATPDRTANARVVIDLTLKHQ